MRYHVRVVYMQSWNGNGAHISYSLCKADAELEKLMITEHEMPTQTYI